MPSEISHMQRGRYLLVENTIKVCGAGELLSIRSGVFEGIMRKFGV